MTKAYSYVRISSKGQIAGTGISRQMEKAREYAAAHGLELDEELHDVGKSGFHGDHVRDGALGGFLRLVKEGQIPKGSYLLVEALDRLSREDVLIAQRQFIDILLAGITVVTLIDNQTYNSERDFTQLILSLSIMNAANDESRKKSERIKHVIKQRKLDALEGKPRYNHHLVRWIDQIAIPGTRDYRFELNDKARSVRKIFELADQGIGAHSITRILNDEGYPVLRENTNTKARWKDATVWGVIRNEICVGTYQPMETIDGKRVPLGEPIHGYYPAAVDQELFWRVQRKRADRKQTGAKGARYSNLFARNTRCASCGNALRYSRGGSPGKYRYYLACSDKLTNSAAMCQRKFFRYDVLEEAVLTYATDFHQAAMDLHSAGRVNADRLERELKGIKTEIDQAEQRRQNTLALVPALSDPQDQQALIAQLNELRGQIEEKKAIRQRLENTLAEIQDERQSAKNLAEQIHVERLKWKTLSDNEVFESRARVANMFNEFISLVEIDFDAMQVTVWIAGFTSAYRFDSRGNLVSYINLLSMLRPLGDNAFGVITSQGYQARKLKEPVYTPALDEAQMVDFMQNMGWKQDRIKLAVEATRKLIAASDRNERRAS